MKITPISLREKLKKIDPVLLLCTLIPAVLSVLTLWGARFATTNGTRRVFVQLAAAVLGMIFTFIIANFDYETLVNKSSGSFLPPR